MTIESITSAGNNSVQTSRNYAAPENLAIPKDTVAEPKEEAVDSTRIQESVMALQSNMKVFHNVNLDFSVHQDTGQIMVTVTDKETGKIIREIPPREILDLTAKLEEMIGIIFDQKI